MTYYIVQKDGHRYDFYNVCKVTTEFPQHGDVELVVISGQFKEGQRYRDVRINLNTIEDTNIADISYRVMLWVS